jgi:hypothetical protein
VRLGVRCRRNWVIVRIGLRVCVCEMFQRNYAFTDGRLVGQTVRDTILIQHCKGT